MGGMSMIANGPRVVRSMTHNVYDTFIGNHNTEGRRVCSVQGHAQCNSDWSVAW